MISINKKHDPFFVDTFRNRVIYIAETPNPSPEWWKVNYFPYIEDYTEFAIWLTSLHTDKNEGLHLSRGMRTELDHVFREKKDELLKLLEGILPQIEAKYVDEELSEKPLIDFKGKELEVYLKVMKRRLSS
jgi:hypothetical protein